MTEKINKNTNKNANKNAGKTHLQKVPKICSIAITPGFSEYIIKTGFTVKIGKSKAPSCKIYLPKNWTGGVMFAVCNDDASQSAAEASQLPERSRCKQNRQTFTADPFTRSDVCYVYKDVCRQVKTLTDQHGNKFTTELKYVLLPAEWTGKKIICIKTLTDEQVTAITNNLQTISAEQKTMNRLIGQALMHPGTDAGNICRIQSNRNTGRNTLHKVMKSAMKTDAALTNIAELSPGFRSVLNG